MSKEVCEHCDWTCKPCVRRQTMMDHRGREYSAEQVQEIREELKKNKENFDAAQKRDHLPCPDTGISHCYDCHGAVSIGAYMAGSPHCGHYAGCPEC